MQLLFQFAFVIVFVAGIALFGRNVRRLYRNIKLGRKVDNTDNPKERFKKMALVAFGQSKMVKRPGSGFLHIIVYLGFIIVNIEILEIIIDGVFGTHRVFAPIGGEFYNFLIGFFEIFALLVLIGVVLFWVRRNITNVYRFLGRELKGWPKSDANYILYFEAVILMLFFVWNASEYQLQLNGDNPYYVQEAGIAGSFPVSQVLLPLFDGMSSSTLMFIERSAWWFHILGILFFLNYLYYSKHLHILLAFPNVYYSKITPQGKFDNLESVTNEVKLMMDPDADPYAMPAEGEEEEVPEKFGASDVMDLNQFQILSAYTCTECGRCTAECPANKTGKLLSPRKIMMDTRDRMEEVGEIINKKGQFEDDGKKLLDDYILREELWACTTCSACVEACPVGIDPLSIIVDMRRYLVMEESAAPNELAIAMTNIENNGAPWPYNQMDRLNWAEEK